MRSRPAIPALLWLLLAPAASAQEEPPSSDPEPAEGLREAPERPSCPQELLDSGGICLTGEQKEKLRAGVLELDDIYKSGAEVEFSEPIVIVRDWKDRVYVNGGEKKPIKMKVRIGEHVDRDMEVQLPIRVFYREEPSPPVWGFRYRFRFQAGLLVPEMVKSIKHATDGDDATGREDFWDAGLSLDFFYWRQLNLSVYAGVRSLGVGPGVDITKNFGLYAGYAFVYEGLGHSMLTSAYFSFN